MSDLAQISGDEYKGKGNEPIIGAVRNDGGGPLSGINDQEYTPLQVNAMGSLNSAIYNSDGEQINSFGSPQLNGTHWSPVHFTASYDSTSTLTLSGNPTIANNSQIVGIQVTNAANQTTQYIAGADGVSFGISSNVITMYRNSVAYTQFVSTDISYRVVLNLRPISQDQDLDVTKTLDQKGDPSDSIRPLINATNDAADTYFVMFTMDNFRKFDLQAIATTSGTSTIFKIWRTLVPTATVTATGGTPSGTVWEDVSLDVFGATDITLTTGTNKNISKDSTDMAYAYMVEYTVDNATNATTVYIKRYN